MGATYGIRGIKEDGKWEYGALTLKEIAGLKTPFFFRAVMLYNDYNTFEILPHGKGTLDERPTVTQIISILKQEENAFTAWENERRR